jgi:hypothetical protein
MFIFIVVETFNQARISTLTYTGSKQATLNSEDINSEVRKHYLNC